MEDEIVDVICSLLRTTQDFERFEISKEWIPEFKDTYWVNIIDRETGIHIDMQDGHISEPRDVAGGYPAWEILDEGHLNKLKFAGRAYIGRKSSFEEKDRAIKRTHCRYEAVRALHNLYVAGK